MYRLFVNYIEYEYFSLVGYYVVSSTKRYQWSRHKNLKSEATCMLSKITRRISSIALDLQDISSSFLLLLSFMNFRVCLYVQILFGIVARKHNLRKLHSTVFFYVSCYRDVNIQPVCLTCIAVVETVFVYLLHTLYRKMQSVKMMRR